MYIRVPTSMPFLLFVSFIKILKNSIYSGEHYMTDMSLDIY